MSGQLSKWLNMPMKPPNETKTRNQTVLSGNKFSEKFLSHPIKMHFLIIWRQFDFKINAFGCLPSSWFRNVSLFFHVSTYLFTFANQTRIAMETVCACIEVICAETILLSLWRYSKSFRRPHKKFNQRANPHPIVGKVFHANVSA